MEYIIAPLVLALIFLFLTGKWVHRKWTIAQLRKLSKRNRRAAYDLYLTTYLWREKRKECFKHDTHRCCRCGSPNRLEAHHITYANLFDEKTGDLRAWCHDCHMGFAPRSDGLYHG